MTPSAKLAAASLIALAAGTPATITAQAPSAPVTAARCEAFAQAQVGEGVELTAARLVAAGPQAATFPGQPPVVLPAHCLVDGVINRRLGAGGTEYGIRFQLALPVEWNGRYLLQGGGGLNGIVRPAFGQVAAGEGTALGQGFAVASHDSGHEGAGFDQSFHADQRASLDFAETSVLTVTQVTRALTQQFYGAAPHHSYFTGCSTGGREGMLASQRYPELFDGIVMGAPAMRPGHSNLGIEWSQVLLNRTQPASVTGPAGVTADERQVITAQLALQCDGADGREDGIIANVAACRSFDPSALACRPGESAGCIAPERVAALQQAFAGMTNAAGRHVYAPIPWDYGITFTGPGLPGYLPAGQPGVFGPANASRDIDVDERLHAVEWDAVGRLTDTPYWTNLSTYLGHQGKLIYFHGVSDPWFSAFDTWDYFERAREANGAEAWDNAARFYMVPGMMHCGGGDAYDSFDLLGPLVDWVESGQAPDAVTASRRQGGGQMPLCPYPAYAHYTGGDAAAAGSYQCRLPEG
ncbi:MAG: tannase/feruloyl esterase family alpha/beta hydrolase [Erythrobacter sp.]|nr:tannase/feruloyl esterase family alpha/beta hydrolase [Erythrobacter sp.]